MRGHSAEQRRSLAAVVSLVRLTSALQPVKLPVMRDATPEEARQIGEAEHRLFGTHVNHCQSIPPQHTPYTMSNGDIVCTTCGETLAAVDEMAWESWAEGQ